MHCLNAYNMIDTAIGEIRVGKSQKRREQNRLSKEAYRLPPGFQNVGSLDSMAVPIDVFEVGIAGYHQLGRGIVIVNDDGNHQYAPLSQLPPESQQDGLMSLVQAYNPQTQIVAAWQRTDGTARECLMHAITPDVLQILRENFEN